MAEKVLMLALSPTMEEGVIQHWNKKEGDSIAEGDVICDVETDKAVMEYESMAEGTLLKILIGEGGGAKVGDAIAIIGEAEENIDSLLEEEEHPEKVESAESVSEQWTPHEKDNTQAVKIEDTPLAPARKEGERIFISPLARSLADRKGIDIRLVTGTGPHGRIVKHDIEAFKGTAPAGITATPAHTTGIPPLAPGEDTVIPLSNTRKVIAQRLSESKFNAPHYYLTLSLNVEHVQDLRSTLKAKGEKVSINAFFIKLVAEALKRHPVVNSSFYGDSRIQFNRIDIGLAVALEDGLITPVIRNAEHKGIREINDNINDLVERARNKKLKPEEFSNATFTISNLGNWEIEEFTAIINPPGSAILAVGKVIKTPVVMENDEIVIKPLVKITMSCDHRIIDGAAGSAFLAALKGIFENPMSALL